MYTTYHLQEEELNEEFLNSVKKLFKNKSLTISIAENFDETEYLSKNEANYKRLKESIEQIKNGKVQEFNSLEEIEQKLNS